MYREGELLKEAAIRLACGCNIEIAENPLSCERRNFTLLFPALRLWPSTVSIVGNLVGQFVLGLQLKKRLHLHLK